MLSDFLVCRERADGDSCCRHQLPLSSCGKQSPAIKATSWAASHMLTSLWQWPATGLSPWVHHTMSKQPYPFMCTSNDEFNLLPIHNTTAAVCVGINLLVHAFVACLCDEAWECSGEDGLKALPCCAGRRRS